VAATSKALRLLFPTRLVSPFLSPSVGASGFPIHLCPLSPLRLFPDSSYLATPVITLRAWCYIALSPYPTIAMSISITSLPVSVRIVELTFAPLRRTPSFYEYYDSSYEFQCV
jgi:hypothetical protein